MAEVDVSMRDGAAEPERSPAEQRYHDTCDRHEARGLVAIGNAESARALRALGIEAHTVLMPAGSWSRQGAFSGANASMCYTTKPEGVDTLDMLGKAVRLANTTLTALARRLARRPDVLAEFRAAFNLDADRDALGDILSALWKRSRVRKPSRRSRKHGPSRAVRDMRKAARAAKRRRK